MTSKPQSPAKDPKLVKLEQKLADITAEHKAKIARHKKKISNETTSAKLAAMDFILDKDNHPHTPEGIKKALSGITITRDDGQNETWLNIFEKQLENSRMRKIFGFPEIKEPPPESHDTGSIDKENEQN